MAIPVQRRIVTFIHKAYSHDPYESIDSISGLNANRTHWRLSQQAAIAAIESGLEEFYFTGPDRLVKMVVTRHSGQKYLTMEPAKDGAPVAVGSM